MPNEAEGRYGPLTPKSSSSSASLRRTPRFGATPLAQSETRPVRSHELQRTTAVEMVVEAVATVSKSTSRSFVRLGLRIACASTVYSAFAQGPPRAGAQRTHRRSRGRAGRSSRGRLREARRAGNEPRHATPCRRRRRPAAGRCRPESALVPVVAPVAPERDTDVLDRRADEGAAGGRSRADAHSQQEETGEEAHVPIVRRESARV